MIFMLPNKDTIGCSGLNVGNWLSIQAGLFFFFFFFFPQTPLPLLSYRPGTKGCCFNEEISSSVYCSKLSGFSLQPGEKTLPFNAESPSECRQPGRYNEQASVLDGFPDPQRQNAVMSKQQSLAFFQSLVLLGLTLLYYVLFCISKSPPPTFCSTMLQTWGLHAQEQCPSVAMVTHTHRPRTSLPVQ